MKSLEWMKKEYTSCRKTQQFMTKQNDSAGMLWYEAYICALEIVAEVPLA